MSTTLETSTRRVPESRASDPVRFVRIRANLMPAEVLGARRAAVVRRRVLAGLCALAVLLGLGYGVSWWQTHSARGDLATAQHEGVALQARTHRFAPLVAAQATTSTVAAQLQRLMAGDLPWTAMLTTLRTTAPAGVQLTSISGTVATAAANGASGSAGGAGGAAAAGPGALDPAAGQAVGTLTLTGTAGDQRAVAAYADRLATVPGLADPFITSVTAAPETRTVSFALTALITPAALGGRYAATPAGAAPAPTGGH